MLTFNVIFLVSYLKKRENFLHKLHVAFDHLSQNSKIKNRVLCFVGLPWSYMGTGAAQAVWLRGVNLSLPIYYDKNTWVHNADLNIKGQVKIEVIKKGFRIKSQNSDKLWFAGCGQKEFSMGRKVVHKAENGKVVDMSFILDEKYLKQRPVFISWDYRNHKFLILDPPLK